MSQKLQGLWAALRTRRIEMKYLITGVLCLGALGWLSTSGLLESIEAQFATFMDETVALGLVGLALGAFASNMIVLVNIPFTLVALTFFLTHRDFGDAVGFALATGIGGAAGKLLAYTLAAGLAARAEALGQSALFRWFERTARRYPRAAPVLVYGGIAVALPNDLVLLPMALIRYPVRRLVLPVLAGKLTHNLCLALVFAYVIGLTGERMTPSLKVDVTFGAVIITLLAILYQVEKARAGEEVPEA